MNVPIETWLEHQGAKEPPFQAVLRRKRNLNVVSFAALVRELEESGGSEAITAQLRTSYQVARSLPPGTLASVFTHPSMTYWSKTTQRLLPFLREGRTLSEHLTEHLQGVAGAEANPVTAHVADLNRFLLAATLIARREVTLPCPVHDGWLSLPGLGLRVASAECGIVQVAVCNPGDRTLRIGNDAAVGIESAIIASGKPREGQPGAGKLQALPLVNGSAGSIWLDHWDPYFRHVWHKKSFPGGVHVFDVGSDELGRWRQTLAASLVLLQDIWPEMESEVSALVHTVVPVNSPVGGMNYSCSSDDFWGAILCSYDPPPVLAEVLVHEFGHIFLFELLEIHGIFAEDSPKEAVYYSPWRPDPRPLLGLLHAVYTFTHVAEYYRRILLRDPSNAGFRERYTLILGRLEMGCCVLADAARFNAEGTAFFESLLAGVRRQRETGEWISSETVQASLDEHLATWRRQHPGLAAPDFRGVR